MRTFRRSVLALLFAFLLSCGLQVAAQTVSGTIKGRVVDATGAVVPNVLLSAKGEQTGLVREVRTNADGYYVLNFMPIGTYELTATFSGFKTIKKVGLKVELNVTTESEFTLTPAGASTEVSVTGEVQLIETSGGDVKSTLESKTIMDRPISGRSFLSLANTVPGFQDNVVGGKDNPTASSGSSVNFNGTGTRASTFQIDGVNNDDSSENQHRQGVNLSTIAQAQILTNNVSAEFGRSYGAVYLVQTKQGTNAIHGDAFWFHQNSASNALNYYAAPGTKITPSRRHDFGGTVGGPIWKNKLFFFGSYEGVRNGGFSSNEKDILLASEIAAGPQNALPTPEKDQKTGLIKAWTVCPNQVQGKVAGQQTIQGPCDGYMTATDQNWIKKFIGYYPTGLTPNDPRYPTRAYVTGTKFHYPDADYTGRIDWNVSDKTTFTSRYQYSHQQRSADTIIQGEATPQDNTQQNLGITLSHVFSNTQTGEFRLGVGRRSTTVNIGGPDGNDTPIVRLSNSYASPAYCCGTILGNSGVYPILRYQTDWQFVYNHYWQLTPKVTIKYGADVRPSQLNDRSDNFTRGYWTVSDSRGVLSDGTCESPDCKYHDAYWNLLHGLFGPRGSFTESYGPRDLANVMKEGNFYLQADIKLTPSFTLNLGIRDEWVAATTERNKKIDYGYNDSNRIGPRIGFAYSPRSNNAFLSKLTGGPGKFAIRGGFGLFDGRIFQSYFSQNGASVRFSAPYGTTPVFDVTLPAYAHMGDPTLGYAFTPGPATSRTSITYVDPNLAPPYSEQWNLSISRELPSQIGLSISYVGNRGIGLPFMNVTNRSQFPFTAPPASEWFAGDPNIKWAGVTFDCVDTQNLASTNPIKDPITGHQCISLGQPYTTARRPNPKYGANYDLTNGSWSYYNALQISLNKRPTHGLSGQFNYTYGHAIDTGSEATATNIDTTVPLTEFGGARSMRGNSLFDIRHRATFNYAYEIPFWKSQHIDALDGTSPLLGSILGKILGGWQVNGTTTIATGTPFSVTAGYDLNGDGYSNDYPFITDPSYLGTHVNDGHYQAAGTSNSVSMYQLPNFIFSPNASTATGNRAFLPGIMNVSNLGRNVFRAAGRFNTDASLQKNFKFGEGKNLMFRVEAYNLFNHPQWGIPTQSAISTSFMKITSTINSARYLQAAFRFSF